MHLDKYNLGLFFTRGVSLNTWYKLGSIDREIKPYIELAKVFSRIYFFTYGDSSDLVHRALLPKNIEIVTKPSWLPAFIYSIFLPIIRYKKLKQIDLYKTNQMDGSWAAVFAKLLFRKKLVVRCGYEWLSFLIKQRRAWFKIAFAWLTEQIAYSVADKIILTSVIDKKFVVNKFSIEDRKIKIIPNYIDINLFKPRSDIQKENKIIFIGRLEEQKNLKNFFKALVGLNIKLCVIGEGSLKLELQNLAFELKLSVDFLGNKTQSEIVRELNSALFFVIPSYYEGNPKALLEAMACGLPCFGSNIEGINNIINNQNGILFEVDCLDLNNKIKQLIQDKELSQKIAEQAREYIVSNNSLEKIIKTETYLYDEII